MNKNIFSLSFLLLLSSCSSLDPAYKNIGQSILGSTGLVPSSSVDAAFAAGEKIGKAAESLTEEQEYYLGRSVSAMVLSKYKLVRNNALNTYVNEVGTYVAGLSTKPATFKGYHVGILDTDEINAVSAPSGFIFISKGFLKRLPDEDALAAVLAHEVAHVALGHGVNAISNSNMTSALLIIGKEVASSQTGGSVQQLTSLFGDSVNDVAETLLTNGYSRSQEYEADEVATNILIKSGYNPLSLKVALQQIEKISEDSEGGWSSTHPKPSKRISEIEDLEIPAYTNSKQSFRAERFKKAIAGI